MDNYPTSHLTLSELASQIVNDPKATDRERDLAERVQQVLHALRSTFGERAERSTDNVGRGDRG
jgi:hypothetical protein